MSNEIRANNLVQIIQAIQPKFDELAKIHGAVEYVRESSFALQILQDNYYLSQVAMGDQDSLKRAIINVAAIGLTLSPVHKLAYLVPRDKKVHLDISYRGFIQLAAEIGSIKWAVAELVHKNDKYTFCGIGKEPIHQFEPFGNRGDLVGVYCLAKTCGDEFILTQMSIEEVYGIRNRSQSWIAYKKDSAKRTPWATDAGEMIKKTVIKRAAKSWPMVEARSRLEKALDTSNDSDTVITEIAPPARTDRDSNIKLIENMLEDLGKSKEKFIQHLTRANMRELKELQDLTDIEMDQAIILLNQFVNQKKTTEIK